MRLKQCTNIVRLFRWHSVEMKYPYPVEMKYPYRHRHLTPAQHVDLWSSVDRNVHGMTIAAVYLLL